MSNKKTFGQVLEESGLHKIEQSDGKVTFSNLPRDEWIEKKEGKKCPKCNKRSLHMIEDPEGNTMCNECYENTWDKKWSIAERVTTKIICPFCDKESVVDVDEGKCDCGAIYSIYDDEMTTECKFIRKIQ